MKERIIKKTPIRRRLEQAYELQYYLRRAVMVDRDIKLLTLGQQKQLESMMDALNDSLRVLEEAQDPPLNYPYKGV